MLGWKILFLESIHNWIDFDGIIKVNWKDKNTIERFFI